MIIFKGWTIEMKATNFDAFFNELYINNYNRLMQYAYRYTGDAKAAEDIVQEVFLIALYKKAELHAHPNSKGWLYNATKICIKRYYAKNNHLKVEFSEEFSCSVELDTDKVNELLPYPLSEENREILILYFRENLPYDEIFRRLGISYAACRQRVSRALAECRELLK